MDRRLVKAVCCILCIYGLSGCASDSVREKLYSDIYECAKIDDYISDFESNCIRKIVGNQHISLSRKTVISYNDGYFYEKGMDYFPASLPIMIEKKIGEDGLKRKYFGPVCRVFSFDGLSVSASVVVFYESKNGKIYGKSLYLK